MGQGRCIWQSPGAIQSVVEKSVRRTDGPVWKGNGSSASTTSRRAKMSLTLQIPILVHRRARGKRLRWENTFCKFMPMQFLSPSGCWFSFCFLQPPPPPIESNHRTTKPPTPHHSKTHATSTTGCRAAPGMQNTPVMWCDDVMWLCDVVHLEEMQWQLIASNIHYKARSNLVMQNTTTPDSKTNETLFIVFSVRTVRWACLSRFWETKLFVLCCFSKSAYPARLPPKMELPRSLNSAPATRAVILPFCSCLLFTCLICSFLFVSLCRLLFWWSPFISLIFPSFLYFSDMFWFFLSFSSCWFSDDLFYLCFLFCFFSWSLRSSRFSFVYSLIVFSRLYFSLLSDLSFSLLSFSFQIWSVWSLLFWCFLSFVFPLWWFWTAQNPKLLN